MEKDKLLTRDDFRNVVFTRDNHKCVICKNQAADAHHIIERRLFDDGGYYIDNGASLCGHCHLDAERTDISCEEIRAAAKITEIILPQHLYKDQVYDKWGNPILPNGQRLWGELMDDLSVKKIMHGYLQRFTYKVKYPRTFHLPSSKSISSDDRVITDLSSFQDQEVVITIKLDGENTSWYSDFMHARSIEYDSHPSRNYVKAMHARVAHDIPERWRVCGENLYAKHSILYNDLPSYFLVFSIWNDHNICLNWDETIQWTELLGLTIVPVAFRGIYNSPEYLSTIKKLDNQMGEYMEGYVIRVARSFHYREFRKVVGKNVRANHVQTHGHWMHSALTPNQLRE